MSDDKLIVGFIKRAAEAGVPVDGIRQLVAQRFGSVEKQASQPEQDLDSVVTSLLGNSGFEKSAQSTGYVHGLLTEAIDAGATFSQAVKIAEAALVESKRAVTKQAADNGFAKYAEDFLKAALDAGYSDGQAKAMLKHVVAQKTAGVDGMQDIQDIFKTSPMAGGMQAMQGGMPAAPEAPNMGQLPPGAIQQLIAMLSGPQAAAGNA
ncbi:MAG: hypothetical protein EBU46_15685 [Nitrosomonadaceae bacterium]|nr:hypothetical protein [Nitrosomonadaceae bacterium]